MAENPFAPKSGSGGGASSSSSSNPFAPGGGKKGKKKEGGLSGAAKRGLGGALGVLTMPQNVIFGLANAAGEASRGNLEGVGEGLKHAGKELFTVGADEDWDFARTLGTQRGGKAEAKKLPRGINTLGTIGLDPLAVNVVGKGAQATKGVSRLATLTGMPEAAISKAIRTGKLGDEAFDLSKGAPMRQQLVESLAADALKGGRKTNKLVKAGKVEKAEKVATKQAEKIAKLTNRRGGGGVTTYIPFTEKSYTRVAPETLSAGGNALKGLPGVAKGLDIAGHAFDPVHDLAKGLGDKALAKTIHGLGLDRQARRAADKDQLIGELTNAVHTVGREFNAEDGADLLHAIETATHGGYDELLQRKPEMKLMVETVKRIGDETTQAQVARGLIGASPANIGALSENLAKLEEASAAAKSKLADATTRAKTAADNARKAREAAERIHAKAGPGSKADAAAKLKKAKAAEAKAEAAAKKARDEFAAAAKGDIAQETRQNIMPLIAGKDDAIAEYTEDVSKPWTVYDKRPSAWEPTPVAGEVSHRSMDLGDGVTNHNFVKADAEGTIIGRFSYIKHPDGTLEGLNVSVDPAARRQGVATSMYDAAKSMGHDVEAASGAGQSYLPQGADFAAGRRAKAAADVVDHSDPKLQALADAARSKADEASVVKAERDALVREAKRLSRGADKGAAKANREAGKLTVKANKLESEARKAQKELDAALASNKGLRENYAQRLPTPEATEAAGRRPTSALAGEVNSSVSRDLTQKAEHARTLFPDMPVQELNALVGDIQAGNDALAVLSSPEMAKFVPQDPEVAKSMLQKLEALVAELPEGATLYEESALGSLMNRGISASAAINAHDFVQELKALKYGDQALLLDEAELALRQAEELPLPAGYVTRQLPHIGTIAAPEALLNEMEQVIGAISKDGFVQEVDKAMNAWTQFWKAHATSGLLGALPFAARNGRSNLYLMYTDGYSFKDILQSMKDAWNLENKIRKISGTSRRGKFVGTHAEEVAEGGLEAALRNGLTAHEYEIWTAMQDKGITTSGLFPTDFADDVHETVRKMTGGKHEGGVVKRGAHALLAPSGAVAQKGRNLNQSVETNARMAHFMLGLDRYGNVDEAAERTKAILFDYRDLTALEKSRLKAVVPFYTFMRKNLPLQLQTLAENPLRIAIPERVHQGLTEALPEDAADYQKDAGARTVSSLIPGFGGMITTPDRPFGAALDSISPLTLAAQGRGKEAFRAAGNVVSGPQANLVKTSLELGTGKDFFTGGGVPTGSVHALQRTVGGQLPSLGRLPGRVGPVTPEKLTGRSKAKKTTANELLKFLTGLRLDKPEGQGQASKPKSGSNPFARKK